MQGVFGKERGRTAEVTEVRARPEVSCLPLFGAFSFSADSACRVESRVLAYFLSFTTVRIALVSSERAKNVPDVLHMHEL